jgi:hypothetical protein
MAEKQVQGLKSRVIYANEQFRASYESIQNIVAELREKCKHAHILEARQDERPRNTHIARVCPECELEEFVWVNEIGESSGFKELTAVENRVIYVVPQQELLKYRTLQIERTDRLFPPAPFPQE